MTPLTRTVLPSLALVAALLAAWLAFSPGTDGEFILDDFPNLSGLHVAQSGDAAGIAQFVLDDVTGTLGRPLSLLTFAFQAHSWRGHPDDFIRVNILIHLLNGLLLCWALLRMLRLGFAGTMGRSRTEVLAVAAVAIWWVMPLQSGAVLYVIQRMAMLAGTFMFAGLGLYLAGRERLHRGDTRIALLLMSSGVGVGLGLGVFAKENAVLFPLLVLVAEFTLMGNVERPQVWKQWALVFLGIPLLLLAGYLLARLPRDINATTQLGFTSPERFLSQPRVLLMYLYKAMLPSMYGIRIMYDDLAASTSLFSPWTTLPSLLACGGLLAVGFIKRRAWPFASFAILWFFGAHSLESSLLPLELAFDHRSYVALAGPALLLVIGAVTLMERPELRRMRALVAIAAGAWFVFFFVAQWQTAKLWAKPNELATYWYTQQPESRRATFLMADSLVRAYQPRAALAVREHAFGKWPGETGNLLSMYSLGCVLEDAAMPGLSVIEYSAARFDGHPHSALNSFNRIVTQVEMGTCRRYSLDFLTGILDRVYEIKRLKKRRFAYNSFRARLFYTAGETRQALDALEESLALRPDPYGYTVAVEWALQIGDLPRADRLLDAAQGADTKPVLRASYQPRYDALREEVRARREAGAATAPR